MAEERQGKSGAPSPRDRGFRRPTTDRTASQDGLLLLRQAWPNLLDDDASLVGRDDGWCGRSSDSPEINHTDYSR